MRVQAFVNAAVGLLLAIACSSSTDPQLPGGAVRVKACHGPATSLPDSLVRLLRPHGLPLIPDDEWARLARTEPGGFAGVYYDSRHQPTIALARPNEAAAAKVALAGHVPFAMDVAVIQPVRWDFAQLSEWFDYLYPKISMVGVSADKDELLNRIRFGAIGVGTRDSVVRILENVDMPCDLVVVDLSGVIAVAGDRGR